MDVDTSQRVYANAGNPAVIELVSRNAPRVLDVGCGAGDNAALLRARGGTPHIIGITSSEAEAVRARALMQTCFVTDLESPLPRELEAMRFDAIIFSHVLEHLRDPATVVERISRLLVRGGECVIAVPNVMGWRERAQFLLGRFEYAATGPLDSTHLRFFSYETAARYLLAKTPDLRVVDRRVTGGVPLWLLRRHVLPQRWCAEIDRIGCEWRPNLFGWQVLIRAIKQE